MSNGHYGIFQGLFSVVKLPVDTENVLKYTKILIKVICKWTPKNLKTILMCIQ